MTPNLFSLSLSTAWLTWARWSVKCHSIHSSKHGLLTAIRIASAFASRRAGAKVTWSSTSTTHQTWS